MITRYDEAPDELNNTHGMDECEEGDYVRYSDYATLTAECERVKGEREYAWGEMKNAQAYERTERFRAEQAEADRDRLRAAVERVRNVPVESFRGSCGGFGCDAPDGDMVRVSDIRAALEDK